MFVLATLRLRRVVMEDIDPRSASVQTIPSPTADWDGNARRRAESRSRPRLRLTQCQPPVMRLA